MYTNSDRLDDFMKRHKSIKISNNEVSKFI